MFITKNKRRNLSFVNVMTYDVYYNNDYDLDKLKNPK